MSKAEIVIKDTHRGLWYEDGVLTKVLEAGRYEIPPRESLFGRKRPLVEVVLVDMRERDLTIKGQEILTADKVALRVSILVQFRVVDSKLAIHAVEKYEDRLYSDVQLAARRSLASMMLEDSLQERERTAQAYSKHPALLRMLELEALGELARNGNVRIYVGFDKHAALQGSNHGDDAPAGG